MIVTHCGTSYECAAAVKCTSDNYIKLYDENGNETAAFYNISDFSDYEIAGGSFVGPCECGNPVVLTTYVVKGRTISTTDWILADDNKYYCEIEHRLISANTTTCNILLFFAKGTILSYTATQEEGKIVLCVEAAPISDIVIDSLQITKA